MPATFPPHFDGKRFFNPNAPQARGLLSVLRWKLTSRAAPAPDFIPEAEPSKPPPEVNGREMKITLVNHSTVLLQQGGLNILTDPVWSERVSPISWAGPRRFRRPGIRFEDLPRIDIVLLSHNHYDHLDLPVIRRLALQPRIEFVVPLGVGRLFASRKITPIHELDWGGSVEIRGITIHAMPALHFSSRSLFDRNATLWCGYMIDTNHGNVYFAGDTGFGEHFAAIREQFDAPRLALLPIGAYEPRWVMSPVHMGPEEAIEAHDLLGAKTSIAIHHGTFQLTDEWIDTPARELAARLQDGPKDRKPFLVLANGESVDLD